MNFETRTDFANHLREHQQATLWACTHCGHADESRRLVENHLASVHTGLSSGNAIVEKSILRDLSKQRCPFCNETPGAIQFVGHLCHHLEEISLAAVPQEVEIDDDDDDDDDDGHLNQSFISESREEESSQIDCSELPDLLFSGEKTGRNWPGPLREHQNYALQHIFSQESRRLLKKDDHPHHIPPLLTNDIIDGTAEFNLKMVGMDSDVTADVRATVRRELEDSLEEELKFPPGNGSNSLVDEFANRMRSDNTATPLGMASHFSPPPERPFKCDQCPQSFNRNADLKRHKRIHVSVKPFPCGHCEKSFSRKDALKVHSSNSSP
jgi:uncharacterized CHY-type Zn-finger protein